MGLPDLPFTDAVRSPDGRKVVRDRLLSLDWTLKTDASGGFALGDTAVLYNGGMLESLRVSRSAALYLTPTDNSTPDIRALPIR